MLSKKTTITIAIIVSIVLISYFFGALSHRNRYFPFPQISSLKNQLADKSDSCPVVNPNKLSELNSISELVNIKNIFWGDSVVEGMHDSRFFNINEYQEVAQSGQVIYCATKEISYILNFNPESVLIYIGGNDADGQSWYGPQQAALYYEQVIDTLLLNNIKPIIHLIHEGSISRDRGYVAEYNRLLMELAKRKNILLIPDVKQFSYNGTREEIRKSNDPYSYDGEHLKPEGYKLWVSNIKQYINDF